MLDLEPIKQRLAAATPGPWSCESDWPKVYAFDGGYKFVASGLIGKATQANKVPEAPPNMVLIAAAPTDIAALVAEVERLRGALAVLREYAPSFCPTHDTDAPGSISCDCAGVAAAQVAYTPAVLF